MTNLPILKNSDVRRTLASHQQSLKESVYAMYSSLYGGVVTDPTSMVIPFDDHMVHRGHAVFDTCTLINGNVYRLDAHLDRFFKSVERCKLKCPYSRQDIIDLVRHTCAAAQRPNASVRYWLSAGTGNFSYSPEGCLPTFWIFVFKSNFQNVSAGTGVDEVTIRPNEVPHKPRILAQMKTTNYALNCLMHMRAKDKGGKMGVWVDECGVVGEQCISSLAIITRDGIFKTAKEGRVLWGCTLERVALLLRNILDGVDVGDVNLSQTVRRHVKGVAFQEYHLNELMAAKEVLSINGDVCTEGIISVDGTKIGGGRVGPVTRALISYLTKEGSLGTGYCHDVPYHEYRAAKPKL